jgi:uncharacterized protein (TIGR00251 family)
MAGNRDGTKQVVRADNGSVVLRVRVKPRASRSRVLGIKEGALEVSVAAAPVDGRANQELIVTLAHEFGLPKSRIEVLSGAHGRLKLVRLHGSDVSTVRGRLGTDV